MTLPSKASFLRVVFLSPILFTSALAVAFPARVFEIMGAFHEIHQNLGLTGGNAE